MKTLQLFVWAMPVMALWPEPSSVSTGTDALFINKDIEVTYNGAQVSWNICINGFMNLE